jgi:hypothetical protein
VAGAGAPVEAAVAVWVCRAAAARTAVLSWRRYRSGAGGVALRRRCTVVFARVGQFFVFFKQRVKLLLREAHPWGLPSQPLMVAWADARRQWVRPYGSSWSHLNLFCRRGQTTLINCVNVTSWPGALLRLSVANKNFQRSQIEHILYSVHPSSVQHVQCELALPPLVMGNF